MNFDSVHLLSRRLELATNEDVDRAERALGVRFPDGYREYVTRFGRGLLNGFLRVYLPSRIVNELDSEFRPRWRESFFWDGSDAALTEDQVLQSVIVADTYQGDELIFHPQRTGDIYLLPRHSNNLPRIGGNLGEAIAWLFGDQGVHEAVKHATFESFDMQMEIYRWSNPGMTYSEFRKLILAYLGDCLTELDLDGVPNKRKVPQNRMMVFPKSFAGQVLCQQDVTRLGRPIEFQIAFDAGEPSPARESLRSRLKELGFEAAPTE